MDRRILIPYLTAGLGHLVHAQAIATFLRRMRPDWDVRLMDATRDLEDALMQRTFVDLWPVVLKMPGPVSRALYGVDRVAPGLVRALNRRSFRTAVPKAAAYLAEHPVDLIMSTHFACSHLFAMARDSRKVPIYYIYGELESAYSVIDCGADLYFCHTGKVSDGLARLGINRAIIRQVPLIVHPAMVRSDVPRDVLRRGLGIPPEHLAVVLSLGGEGIGRTIPFIEAFAREVKGATLIVLTGRNAKLLDKVRRRVRSPAVVALGYQEDLSPIIAAADALAGKCGTGFVSLAVATGVPLIVTHIGAPPELGSMRFIVENGHGWYCPRPRMFVRKVSELTRERASCTESSGAAERAVAQNGAETIAAAVVEALS
jgi:UDP-N-acetylglucosamine:LPS N-acetylglucosamine transferase